MTKSYWENRSLAGGKKGISPTMAILNIGICMDITDYISNNIWLAMIAIFYKGERLNDQPVMFRSTAEDFM